MTPIVARGRAFALALSLAVGIGLLGGSALADSRTEAKRHFRKGMESIRAGEIDAGIAMLVKAYETKPHPSVLYNIARAYSDVGDVAHAVEYFERYLESHPDDADRVEKVVRTLRARLLIPPADPVTAAPTPLAPVGPGPVPPATAPSTMPAAPGVGDRLSAIERRMEYLTKLLESGAMVPPKRAGVTPVEPVPTGDLELEDKAGDLYDLVVVSASRVASSPLNAPSATTIITDEDIRLSGATSIPDVLRRVPGMETLAMTVADTELSIRGFNQRISNKLLVLVNGRSVYLDFLGGTFWRYLSISLEDIERIEVIHGPGSTMYGASAFGGVVNIITRPPGERRNEVTLTGGMGETLRGTYLFGGRAGSVGYRASIGYEQADKWSLEFDEDRADLTRGRDWGNLALRLVRFDTELKWVPARKVKVGLSAGLASGYSDFSAIGAFRSFWMNGFFGYVMADAELGPFRFRTFINHLDVDAGPEYIPTGTLDLDTNALADVVDAELIFHHDFDLVVPQNLFVGVGYRLKTIDWDYLDRFHVEHHFEAFIEDRLAIHSQLDVTLGFRIDVHPLVGVTPSSRGAVVFRPADGMAIRLTAGTAFRTPTFLESYLDLRVPSPVAAVSIRSLGDRDLRPESIFQVDLGYVYAGSDFFSAEVVGYFQTVRNFVDLGDPALAGDPGFDLEEARRPDPDSGTFIAGVSSFENSSAVSTGGGVEIGGGFYPIDGIDVKVSYVFEYMRDSETGERDQRNPLHKINLGLQLRSRFGVDFNLDTHFVSNINVPEREFNPVTLDIERVDCRASAYVLLNARIGYRMFKDKLEVAVSGFNLLQPVLDIAGLDHREHCFANELGTRAHAWLTYRF